MRYPVEVRLRQPEERPRMDSLQQVGAESLLRFNLWQLMVTEGLVQKGSEQELVITDLHVCTKPDGAHLVVPMEVGSLAVAEEITRSMVRRTLQAAVLLADWRMIHCGVKLDEDAFGDAPAPASRTVRVDDCGSSPLSPPVRIRPARSAGAGELRARLTRAAASLGAFGPSAFGHEPGSPDTVDEPSALLAAGALYDMGHRITVLALRDNRTLGVSRLVDASRMGLMSLLPPAYRDRYEAAFANWMLVTVTEVAGRLARPGWTPPRTLAEALALHVMVLAARDVLVRGELLSEEDTDRVYGAFRRAAFTDDAHERLYTTDPGSTADPVFQHLDVAPGGVTGWFAVGGDGHPYLAEQLGGRPTVYDAIAGAAPDSTAERIRAELGLDPGHLFTLIDLAAVGIVEGTWQATTPAVRPEVPVSQGDLWRILCYHRHTLQRRLRDECARLGLGESSTVDDLLAAGHDGLTAALRDFGGWLTDPHRTLPSGHTVGELAGEAHGVFCDIVAHNVSTIGGYIRTGGLRHGLLIAAKRGGLLAKDRYGTPGWPDTLDLITPMLTGPNHPDWGVQAAAHGGIAALLPVYNDEEFTAVRDLLADEPWRVDSTTADCVAAALIAKLTPAH